MRGSFAKRGLASRSGVLLALAWTGLASAGTSLAGTADASKSAQVSEGLRLFLTDWSGGGQVGSKGDGLGPVFNEKSCVACHSQGGPGGAGGSRVDVMILTDNGSNRKPDGTILEPDPEPGKPIKPLTSGVFPGFARERSLVIHRYATDPGYESWRQSVLQSFGLGLERSQKRGQSEFTISRSFRNTPALFGSGLIDAIPESVLEAASLRKIPEFPEIKGRPGRLKDGRTGRFGWKAQTASLNGFVRIACANELGLENPGHSQSPDPLRPKYKAPGFDLTEDQCASLTSYIAGLPQPVESTRAGLVRSEQFVLGRQVFEGIGCAACHLPKLGDVEGIYSDLLLHDMGQGLSDSGEYYGGDSSSPGLARSAPKGSEWRTPPLWGLRNSAPYLHDGRAANVDQAIAMHGGEGELTANRYQKLDSGSKQNLRLFLQTLGTPPQPEDGRKAKTR